MKQAYEICLPVVGFEEEILLYKEPSNSTISSRGM